MTFKKYQSHKTVEADKIISFEKVNGFPASQEQDAIQASQILYILQAEDGTKYEQSEKLFARGEPQDDYFYLVKYDDGYTSWSPKDAFEQGYKPEPNLAIKGFDFGIAICHMKKGKRVARQGWNGKNMYLILIQGSNDIAKLHGYGFGEVLGEPTFQDTVYMKTVDNKLVAWTCSQTDMLAEDWCLVE